MVALVGALLAAPQAALAREIGTSWTSETEGLPASTLQGSWAEEPGGRRVSLNFAGGHVAQAGTTFEARWVTPFTSKGKRPKFETSFELENINEAGQAVVIEESFRYRVKGERWTGRFIMTTKLRRGMNYFGGSSSFLSLRKTPVQFEWILSGKLKAPATLRGSVDLWIN